MKSSRRGLATGAWLLALGLFVSAGAATAFADVGSNAATNSDKSATANKHDAKATTGGDARSARDDAATTPGAGEKSADGSGAGTEASDPTNTPKTQVTFSPTETVGDRKESGDVAPTGEPAADTETAPTSADPAPQTDAAPTTEAEPTVEESSSPKTNALLAGPPSDDPPPTTDAASDAPSDTADPLLAASDAPPASSNQGSDTASSDATAASTAPSPAPQDPSQSATSTAHVVAVPEVTTVLEELLAPSPEPVASPVEVPAEPAPVVVDAPAVLQYLPDDENTRGRPGTHNGSPLSPLQILGMLTHTARSNFVAKTTGIPTLLDGPNQMHLNGPATTSGSANLLEATSATRAVAPVEPDTVLPEGLKTFLHSYGQAIVVVSLSAMFVAALPGLIGMLIPAAAGVHIGHRQAKAGRALHTSGIAHLAASGPIGVVRSGSLVSLRPSRRHSAPARVEDRAKDVA